ncbi:hypothetical protein IFM89_023831 [Coptis chinensis]|uniref:DDT domain-containing protein DDR4 n=1 Tax=Coptis chinensis TaxID=261450 RepID=A0A835IUT3_9MAGN|nr:hypothetical protein IFM89_023831 [Coptis chinensis]
MSEDSYPSPNEGSSQERQSQSQNHDNYNNSQSNGVKEERVKKKGKKKFDKASNYVERPRRACTSRPFSTSSPQLYSTTPIVREKSLVKKEEQVEQVEKSLQLLQCSSSSTSNNKIITPLIDSTLASPLLLPRQNLRAMGELAALLNFLNVFRPLLNIRVEFSAEELETALITPNSTLDDIHIPLLKLIMVLTAYRLRGCPDISIPVTSKSNVLAIPPVTRMALGRATWVTVLCRKLRDWWHWVADSEIPIVASHGVEAEMYKTLDPGTRLVILKALCDIRVEQEDIRNYIDGNLKHGVHISVFRKERIGGNSLGISYWYEDDAACGHRLYREIRKVEVKKVKAKGFQSLPSVDCQWETVATNFDEFQEVSEKLFSSKNRTEAALGKKLQNDMLPGIEKIHKKKEKLVKKQHREAILLDNLLTTEGLSSGGRALRDRKPVTYTFDDYDRSINEAIKITKRRQSSPEYAVRKEVDGRFEASSNGRWNEAISDNDVDFDSDDEIVGEAIYDEEYLRNRKQRKVVSSSEGDEEYHWEEENAEDEEEQEEEEDDDDDDSSSSSEDIDDPRRFKKLPSSSRRETKLRSVGELQSGLRRSRRATRNQINYRQYELSESEADSMKPEKSSSSDRCSDASNTVEYLTGSQDLAGDDNEQEMDVSQPAQECNDTVHQEQRLPAENTTSSNQEVEVVGKRHFLDLNELAPGCGFDDGPDSIF